VVAIGIANQRETTLVWERDTGRPVGRAVVWQDTRTGELVDELAGTQGADRFRDRCGLPLAPYFAGPRLAWLLEHVKGLRGRAERGEVLFGTMETWLVWNLTGGPDGGVHVTDVTNASRTMLMGIDTLQWDDSLLGRARRPAGRAAGDPLLERGLRHGHRRAARHADRRGPRRPAGGAVRPDLLRARRGQVHLRHGQLPAAQHRHAHRPVDERPADDGGLPARRRPAHYALEGSIAITGSLVQWFRDGLGLISSAPEIETLALTVEDNGGCYIVPAFAGCSPRTGAATHAG
jgi:glycerol kinase